MNAAINFPLVTVVFREKQGQGTRPHVPPPK